MYILICETDCQSRFDAWDRVLRAAALGWPRGMGWGGRWKGSSGWGTHVHPWMTHVNVWQNPLQYCKVIGLQLKFKKRNCFVLGYSQLTMLWQFRVDSEGTQPFIYMYAFSPKLPSHPGCNEATLDSLKWFCSLLLWHRHISTAYVLNAHLWILFLSS